MARDLAGVLLPRILVGGVITIALTILFSLPGGTVRADGSFDTTTDFFFCNQLPGDFSGPAPLPGNPSCMGDFSPGANPNFGFTWDMPSGDYNFSTFATFISGEFSIAADADIDDGTVVGGNKTTTTLGLGANICGGDPLLPQFILYDSTTDTSNTVDALPEGDRDRFSILAKDGGDAFTGQADADSPAVLKYPSFLNTLLDPDLDYPGDPSNGPLDPISPWARYTGLTQVSSEWIFFTILVFEKTQLEAFVNDPSNAVHPFARYGRNPDEAGWVHILILQDPSQLVSSPSAIGDFCTPMLTDIMLLGQVTDTTHGTVNRLTSPAANTGIDSEGTHPLLLYAMSYRDADGDGLENGFDTCVWTANTAAQDPYNSSGPDTDMLDSVCDPTPGDKDDDEDGDFYLNNQDYCPLVTNTSPDPPPPNTPGPGETDAESGQPYGSANPDSGPPQDQIGDDCDGEQGGNDLVSDGAYWMALHVDSVCIGVGAGATDADSDGWCAADDPDDSDADNPGQLTHFKVDTSLQSVDSDGDGATNYTDWIEWVDLGTDPRYACPLILGHDAWPPDFDTNRVINITDVFKVLPPVFGSSAGQPNFSTRADLSPDGVINITDVFKVLPPVFGSSTGQPLFSERVDVAPDGVINITDVFKVLPPVFGTSCTP